MIFETEVGHTVQVEVECGFDDPVDEVYIKSVIILEVDIRQRELVECLNDSTMADLLIEARKVLSERKLEAKLNLVE